MIEEIREDLRLYDFYNCRLESLERFLNNEQDGSCYVGTDSPTANGLGREYSSIWIDRECAFEAVRKSIEMCKVEIERLKKNLELRQEIE